MFLEDDENPLAGGRSATSTRSSGQRTERIDLRRGRARSTRSQATSAFEDSKAGPMAAAARVEASARRSSPDSRDVARAREGERCE